MLLKHTTQHSQYARLQLEICIIIIMFIIIIIIIIMFIIIILCLFQKSILVQYKNKLLHIFVVLNAFLKD